MATTTPNLDLTLPAYDDLADVQVLNDNFSTIDATAGEYLKDSGWVDVEIQNGFEKYNPNSRVSCRKIGKTVFLYYYVKPTDAIAASSTTVAGLIPVGYRPQYGFDIVCQGSGMNRFTAKIETNGEIKVGRYGTTANSEIPVGAWLPIYTSYVTA